VMAEMEWVWLRVSALVLALQLVPGVCPIERT
jgi:hypothetical protein